jgi:hypothetical protein
VVIPASTKAKRIARYDRVGASLGRIVDVGPTAAERDLEPPPAREIGRAG